MGRMQEYTLGRLFWGSLAWCGACIGGGVAFAVDEALNGVEVAFIGEGGAARELIEAGLGAFVVGVGFEHRVAVAELVDAIRALHLCALLSDCPAEGRQVIDAFCKASTARRT